MDRPPPVAATVAVMSTRSSRPNSHATGRGRPPGPNRSRTPDETAAMSSASVRTTGSWPGTKPDGMTGPTASSSAASPSRAQANPRSSALTLSAFTTSLHHRDQLEDRQVHCDDEATDDDAEEHDHERLEQRRERGHRDRKSTRLNSSHQIISYAVFCLKKKKQNYRTQCNTCTTRT